MEKLRESLLAKIVAGILLSVFLFLAFVSGVMAFFIYDECGYMPKDKDETKKQIVTDIATGVYGSRIEYYYEAVLDDSTYEIRNYENLFERENCNLSFTAVGTDLEGNDIEDMPELSNYSLEDYQYHIKDQRYVSYAYGYRELRMNVSIDTILFDMAQKNEVDIIIWPNYDADAKIRVYTYGGTKSVSETDNVETLKAEGETTETANQNVIIQVDDETYDGDYDTEYDSGYDVTEASVIDDYDVEYYSDVDFFDEVDDSRLEVFGNGDFRASGRNRIIYDVTPNIYVTDDLNEFGVYLGDLSASYIFPESSSEKKEVTTAWDAIVDGYDCYDFTTYYDESDEEIVVGLSYNKEALISIDMKVAENLTANDNFSTSWELWMVDKFYGGGIPLFVISFFMVIILTVFICVAAGHRKGEEGIVLNHFDRVPFDLLLTVPVVAIFSVAWCADNVIYHYSGILELIICICMAGAAFLMFPIYLNTTAARSKTGTLLKNTVV